MASLSLNLRDEITPGVDRVINALTRADVRRIMGRAIVQVLKDHFRDLDSQRHRPEVPLHFYNSAARGVQQPDVSGDGLTVTINNVGIGQRYFGGTLTAGSNGSGKKFLTIPAVPQAMGRRAGEFTNLKFVFFGKRRDIAALVSQDDRHVALKRGPRATKERKLKLVPRQDGRPQIIFWLVRSVVQKEDPSVLPSFPKMRDAAFDEAEGFLAIEWERQQGGSGTSPQP